MSAYITFHGVNEAGEAISYDGSGGCLGFTGKIESQVEGIKRKLSEFRSVDSIVFEDLFSGMSKENRYNPVRERILSMMWKFPFIKNTVMNTPEEILKTGDVKLNTSEASYNEVMLAIFHLRCWGHSDIRKPGLSVKYLGGRPHGLELVERIMQMGIPYWKAYIMLMCPTLDVPSGGASQHHSDGWDASCCNNYQWMSVAHMKKWIAGNVDIEYEGDTYYQHVLVEGNTYVRNITSRMFDRTRGSIKGSMYALYRDVARALRDASQKGTSSDVFGSDMSTSKGVDFEAAVNIFSNTIDQHFGA